ncbi:capsular polysaccharide biosynthesis protein [Planococcus donghaensis MPA1U2]|uniref:Capsular polysaccharide biosynthesis protein n=1 Tax=Planococcus donghaensis MPA1U2 TaxID=933115 RepID=E7RDS0_9BACL|nr:glycosyltransferase family 4 protein [Planococcus donghaensis]EGA90826.1 capsular polysaccharide biosynthesis protein [Planococcus donghaensis MPA1U2]
MKKILFVSNISNKITNFSIPSIEAAKAQGYDFHMAANYSGYQESSSSYQVTLHHIDMIRNPLNLKNIKAFKQMNDLIKTEKFDVIHCNTPLGGILGRICGRKANVSKIIYTAHGFHFYKGAPLINRILYRNIEKWLAHHTDSIITINEEDYFAAKKFKLKNEGSVYSIPGVGINTNEYQDITIDKDKLRKSLGLEKDNVILISMGDLIKRKNYTLSIEALAMTKNSNVYYLICGQGPELENLKKLAKEKGVEQQVRFLGHRSDIKELLTISDIFLFTTLQEGLPRSMMEAMASGLPCIASKIRGNTDLIESGNGGFLVNLNDTHGFTNAIEVLSKDRLKREIMGKKNLEKIREYDVENIKALMLDIYIKELPQ